MEIIIAVILVVIVMIWLTLFPQSEQRPLAEKTTARSQDEIGSQIQTLPHIRIGYILDGDTCIANRGWSEMRIRLDSIDCPEIGQDWGDTAKYGLIKLIGGRGKVKMEEHGVDDYGRVLATLYVWSREKREWVNVNERMVMLGHAWVMQKFYDHLPPERQDRLNRLQAWARSKKVGLWKNGNAIAPWSWRNGG